MGWMSGARLMACVDSATALKLHLLPVGYSLNCHRRPRALRPWWKRIEIAFVFTPPERMTAKAAHGIRPHLLGLKGSHSPLQGFDLCHEELIVALAH